MVRFGGLAGAVGHVRNMEMRRRMRYKTYLVERSGEDWALHRSDVHSPMYQHPLLDNVWEYASVALRGFTPCILRAMDGLVVSEEWKLAKDDEVWERIPLDEITGRPQDSP